MRILVCNAASFGDVVISTVVLPVLKRQYPGCEIGFLTTLKTVEVLKEHPLVSYVHTINHWFCNREQSFYKAFFHYLIDLRRVIKEIRQRRYEIGIDLYSHFFLSAIPILWRAKIPVRIGRFISGYSNLLTHIVPPSSPSDFTGQTHLNLLKILGIDISQESPFPYCFSQKNFSGLCPQKYVVVHMGSGYRLKEWDMQKWTQLVTQLIDQQEMVVVTGEGEREKIQCDQVAFNTGCLNYCNRLSWAEFVSVIQHAKLLISVDSVSVHLASAVQIPCVVLFAGISSIPIWKPPYSKCKVLMRPVACAPCLIREGCSRMSCIQEIQINEVLQSVNELQTEND